MTLELFTERAEEGLFYLWASAFQFVQEKHIGWTLGPLAQVGAMVVSMLQHTSGTQVFSWNVCCGRLGRRS